MFTAHGGHDGREENRKDSEQYRENREDSEKHCRGRRYQGVVSERQRPDWIPAVLRGVPRQV